MDEEDEEDEEVEEDGSQSGAVTLHNVALTALAQFAQENPDGMTRITELMEPVGPGKSSCDRVPEGYCTLVLDEVLGIVNDGRNAYHS